MRTASDAPPAEEFTTSLLPAMYRLKEDSRGNIAMN
jgi:hypothetical protein